MISTQKFTEVGLVPVFGEIIISIPHCRKGDDTITLRNDEWEDRENLMLKLQEFKEQGYALSLQRGNQMILIQGYNPKNNCWVTGRGTANTGYFIPFEEGDSVHKRFEADGKINIPYQKKDTVNLILPQSGG